MKELQNGKPLYRAAMLSEMDEKTARKYVKLQRLPEELAKERTWRTHADAFDLVWQEVEAQLKNNVGLEAKTIFEWLQRKDAGSFQDGQLRTLQRRIKTWRATKGPEKEVFFDQRHLPGRLCQSDFTRMEKLGVTIAGLPLSHMVFHFALTYSNWETGTLCYSESFESLSEGLQNALWELGGVAKIHQTDCLSAAVRIPGNVEAFTSRYKGLLKHYGLDGLHSNPASANENGDVEQAHHRFKKAVAQALLLRGSKDFGDIPTYESFLKEIMRQRNLGRRQRFLEEVTTFKALPERRLEACTKEQLRVGQGSTIRVKNNTYSVNSRLVGETVEVRIYADHLEVWYAQQQQEKMARLRGDGGHQINYRHIIGSLLRKPGAFARYRYQADLFPTIRFRMAYDSFSANRTEKRAAREYLEILELAALESESRVDAALGQLIETGSEISAAVIAALVDSDQELATAMETSIDDVELQLYDQAFLTAAEVLA